MDSATTTDRWRAREQQRLVPRIRKLSGTYVAGASVATNLRDWVVWWPTGMNQPNSRNASVEAGVVHERPPAEPAYDDPGEHGGHGPGDAETGVSHNQSREVLADCRIGGFPFVEESRR